LRTPSIAKAYQQALLNLADSVASLGARLIVFLPLPSFRQAQITMPLSLCHVEWFRPAWALPADCKEVVVRRDQALAEASLIRDVQKQAASRSMFVDLFDPFPAICAPADHHCSNHQRGRLLFSDGSHLTAEGAQLLHDDFARFLTRTASAPSTSEQIRLHPASVTTSQASTATHGSGQR
jgi:hypothetical protein